MKKVCLTNVGDSIDMLDVKLPVETLISESLYQEFNAAHVTGIKFKHIDVVILNDQS